MKELYEEYIYLLERKDHLIDRLKNLNSIEKSIVKSFFYRKPQLEKKIDWNNNNLLFSDFSKIMNKPTKTDKRKTIKKGLNSLKEGKDYIKISTHDWLGYIPLNYEASKIIASKYVGDCEGRWCTAYQKDNRYWIEEVYEKNNILMYILVNSFKYALTYNVVNNDVTIWSKLNAEIPEDIFYEISDISIENDIRPYKDIFIKAHNIMVKENIKNPMKKLNTFQPQQ